MKKNPKIVIKPAGKKKGQCMVVVIAANGKVLQTSEILSSTRRALSNIAAAAHAFNKLITGKIKIKEA